MYNLPYFKERDQEKVMEFMRRHAFVTLCGCNNSGKPVATQVPVLFREKDGRIFLEGHIMKHTDHHKAFTDNPNVLAVFSGPHVYVSASWYSDPRQASTWNYMSVQAHGMLKFLDEPSLMRILKETTEHFENNPSSPAGFDHLPENYVSRLSKAIIAFEIAVKEIENVFKLSQNRDESYHTIISELGKQDHDARLITAEMQQRAEKLFAPP